jgi:predicted ABC-type transport system involved in lysophospholipase L1 biosynthesis ATPase subunit
MIHMREVWKEVTAGDRKLAIVRGANLSIAKGEAVALLGPSGAGKTTLLNLAGTVDHATSGEIVIAGRNLATLNRRDRALLRRNVIGFVFQHFHLLGNLSALENVAVPLLLKGVAQAQATGRAAECLDAVGLKRCAAQLPAELSGGERQRVAIARALVSSPQLVLADEPTGALDSETGARILDLLFDLNRSLGAALLIVTHEPSVAARCARVLHMRDGVLSELART